MARVDKDLQIPGNLSVGGTVSFKDDAISPAMLSGNLNRGVIDLLPLLREITAGDIPAAASNGGLLAKDTTPILEIDSSILRLNWAASNSDVVGCAIMSPQDLDKSQVVTLKIRAKMASTTDTPTIAVLFKEDGGSDLGGATAALSDSYQEVTRDITVTADPPVGTYKPWLITLTPGAHTTDALYLTGCWLEYTKK